MNGVFFIEEMMMTHKHIIQTPADLESLAITFVESLPAHSVVCLEGEMGVGKTTFTQFVLHALGIDDVQGSPTYSIVNEYVSPTYGKVYHLDLYRIEEEEELYDIGLEEILYSDAFVFIEWPSRAENMIPETAVYLTIKLLDSGARLFEWKS